MEEKQVYENQETAIKLLNENIDLKKRIQKALNYINGHNLYDIDIDENYYDVNDGKARLDLLEILEGDKNE